MKKFLLLTTLLCGWMGSAMAEELPANYITVKSETASAGAVIVSLDMYNEKSFVPCAFQCDIKGAEFDKTTLELAVGDRNAEHKIESNVLSDGTLRIVCYSMTNAAITGTEGTVATFKTNLSETTEFTVNNIVIADKESVSKKASDLKGKITIGGVKVGDVNGDGSIDGLDLVDLKNYILGLDTTSISKANADVDGDGSVDGIDLAVLKEIIMGI